MIINWYGEACFKIQTSGTVILTDPFESSIGLTPPRFKADITLLTKTPLSGMTFPCPAIAGPGEYEIREVEILGWSFRHPSGQATNKTVYLVNAEGLRLGFLGHLADETLDSEAAAKLGGADILFVPAGGKPFIGQEKAAKLIKQIGPKMVIASLFKTPGLKRKADDVKEFLKELELKTEPQEKLTIKKKDLVDKLRVAVLKV